PTSHTSATEASSTSTAYSSPPKRARQSSRRRHPSSRPAIWRSRSSPAACPHVSLTSLNRSRSTNSTCTRARRLSARSSRSRNSTRLGRPVTGSRTACRAVARVLASDSATLTWSAKVSRVCSWASVNGCPPPEDPPPENPPPEDPPEDPPPEDPLRQEPVWNETTT